MLNFLNSKLSAFRTCFSRTQTFKFFVAVIIGFLSRSTRNGVTSIVDRLGFSDRVYDSIIHFFHCDGYTLEKLVARWLHVVKDDKHLFKLGDTDRNLLIGDGCKVPKEGLHMPAVKKLHQESEDTTKAEYIFGHMLGSVGVLISNGKRSFCTPLITTIQDGLKDVAAWSTEFAERSESHVVQIIQNAYLAASELGPSYLALDRYFLTVPVLIAMNVLNSVTHLLDIITRAKTNCVGYEKPLPVEEPRRGRPRIRGERVKLYSLFESRASDFIQGTVQMYGAEEQVEYLPLNLLWGKKLYQEVLFVLVKSARGQCILVSTDLSLDPILVIEAYARRFSIETMFKALKTNLGGFAYHFWSKSMPKLNRWAKKDAPSPLSQVAEPENQKNIIGTVKATERFVHFASITLGITQMMALQPQFVKIFENSRYLRTRTPGIISEETVLEYFRKNIFWILLRSPWNSITQIIRQLQKDDCDEQLTA